MNKEDYKKALQSARTDLESALEEREEVDKRIAALKRTVFALTTLCDDKPTRVWMEQLAEEVGLTNGCREILKSVRKPWTPVEVRDHLKAIGFDLTKYSSPLASIHSVLKRLLDGEEVEITPRPDGTDGYRWRGTASRRTRFPRVHRRERTVPLRALLMGGKSEGKP